MFNVTVVWEDGNFEVYDCVAPPKEYEEAEGFLFLHLKDGKRAAIAVRFLRSIFWTNNNAQ